MAVETTTAMVNPSQGEEGAVNDIAGNPTAVSDPGQPPVIIKNANLELEAENVTDAYDKLLNFAKESGGYEISRDISKQGEYAVLHATFKVKAEQLEAVLEFANECGKIINTSINSNDVSAEFYDTKIRLENMRKNLEKYYEFYDKAATLEETLMLQKEIDSITANIESYEGQLKFWSANSSDSTISVYIREPNDPIKIKKNVDWSALSFSDMGTLMGNGFTSVFNVIVATVQWLAIGIVAIIPVIVIAGVALLVVIIIRRRKKNK